MKSTCNFRLIAATILAFFFVACNQKKDEEKSTHTDSTVTKKVEMNGFEASMDATTVSGYPARVLADSLGLKPYEFVAKPGDSIPIHMHPDHVLYVLEGGTARITAKEGGSQVVEFKTGSCNVNGPAGHSAKNIGTTTLRLLIVHVYRPRG